MDEYLSDDGKLLITEYRSRKEPIDKPWLDDTLKKWKFNIIKQTSGIYDDKELTRVWVITKRKK